ncbi:MAG: hypothetical protein ABSB35_20105 [Bryobacteraceae bacterium]|jgi:hypothetical protein
MSRRVLISVGALAVLSLAPVHVAGQAPASGSNNTWTASLTPDGQPDLQGNWVNKSATPLERPKQLEGRQLLTDAEVAELKKRAGRIFKDGKSDFAQQDFRDNVYLAVLGNVEQYTNPTPTTGGAGEMVEIEFDNRTSLIVDPPDGKLPPYTPAGQRRQNALDAARFLLNHPAGPADLTNFQRCITWGVPMPRPSPNSSYYQIVQSPDYVVLVMETIHDARIIPLDGRPHLPQSVRTWNGDSIGHWEGKTLVVDTTNFSPKDNFMGSAEDLHLIERFTRVAPDEIRYEITVDDPTTWTKPWTAVLRLKQTQEKLYEVACHEGNFEIMEDMLRGARKEDK